MSGIAQWRSETGQLQIGRCNACAAHHYYPRKVCPFCFSADVSLSVVTGRGKVYSHSFTPRGPNGPYMLAYVTLDEGVTMLTHLVDVAVEDVLIDMSVAVEFRLVGDSHVPVFKPA